MSRALFPLVIGFVLLSSVVSAEIPQVISYQGKVTDTSGVPVSDGDYSMTFTIYNAESGGTSPWNSGSLPVPVSDGIFSVLLGDTGQPALDLEFDEDYWLEVNISGDVQNPRSRLGSVGYAYMASGLVPGTEVVGAVGAAVIKGNNTSTLGAAYGMYGSSASQNGWGVLGEATSLSGSAYGVVGYSFSTDGTGVFGSAIASSGLTEGVYGGNSSTLGRGVYGEATATWGDTYGVYGKSSSTAGTGVCGYAGAGTGNTYGMYGVSSSTSGRGVYGEASASTGMAYGVHGTSNSTSGRGVFGETPASSGATYGVYGKSSSTAGRAVYGFADATTGNAYGVYGISNSTDGRGVFGQASASSGDTYGVYASTNSAAGIGVYGYASSTTGLNFGGQFVSEGDTGRGLGGYALSTTGDCYGTVGTIDSPAGIGVYGGAGNSTGNASGVRGTSLSTSGYGVVGGAFATTGVNYGVYGESNSPNGFGVYYVGGIAGTGTKSCVVKTSQGPTLMYCQESPENWFEDFGEGRLVNGSCHVELDPFFLETVTISKAHPMHVFIEPHGPCNATYVTRGLTGFEVIEHHGGSSTTSFSYRVVARRKGFEAKRLDVCRAGLTDPLLYPELKDMTELERFRTIESRGADLVSTGQDMEQSLQGDLQQDELPNLDEKGPSRPRRAQ